MTDKLQEAIQIDFAEFYLIIRKSGYHIEYDKSYSEWKVVKDKK